MPERVTLNEIIITPTHNREIKPEEKINKGNILHVQRRIY